MLAALTAVVSAVFTIAVAMRYARSKRVAPNGVQLTLLDRQPIVAPATLAAYAAAGWRADTLTADVLDWADDGIDAPAAADRWDVVVANLFLHHFEGERLVALLHGIETRARAFVCFEFNAITR